MTCMLEATSDENGQVRSLRPFLPLLLLLFVGSGCAALIYEIVWFQMLQLVIGSSAVSLAVLLGTFMGGMCLGSLLLPWLLSSRLHPLRVYGMLEMLIGLCGLGILWGMPYVSRLYLEIVGHGFLDILMRGVACAICLLLPTMLMGATLPAIARWVETTRQGVSWMGFFYGGNIAGAVFGCLLAGFYLLRVHDLAIATHVAVVINAAVAFVSIAISIPAPFRPPAAAPSEDYVPPQRAAWTVYIAIGLSGASALAAEVIWTRLLSLLLGATVYTFSIILAVFLVGLGIGSSLGAAIARNSGRPRLALGVCQLLLAGAVFWTAYVLADSLPYWPISPYHTRSVWIDFQIDLARCFWAILPGTVLWGASFPLALAAVARRGQDPGRMVGGVYAANTVGAVVGALAASLYLVPALGSQDSQRLIVWFAVASAGIALAPLAWPLGVSGPAGIRPFATVARIMAATAIAVSFVAAASYIASNLPRVPWQMIALGRLLPTYEVDDDNAYYASDGAWYTWKELYVGEGMNSSVAVLECDNGMRSFHVSGKVEASTSPTDMRLQRMLGHIPALVHPNPKSILVVGCGAGVTAGSFVVHPGVERIVICEIEPLVPTKVADFFKVQNYDVVHDPRVEIVYDDARHYILTTHESFDIITSDPIHPWVKGSATLYTTEYFEMCKKHLNPGGVVTQWVPLYESDHAVVKSQFATFFEVFPDGSVWVNDQNPSGYDTVLLGQAEPTQIDVDRVQDRLDQDDHERVRESLRDVGFESAVALFLTFAAEPVDLLDWLDGAQINRDRNLRLQYLAGMQLNKFLSSDIFKAIVKNRTFPEKLFVGKGEKRDELRYWFGQIITQ